MTKCRLCGRKASEINEYIRLAEEYGCSPDEAVMTDGTYNPLNRSFYCTECYVAAGMPLNVEQRMR